MFFSDCCAIVGSASFDAEHYLREREAGLFACTVAADGGFASLERAGVAPDVALGDFDSLGYVPEAPRVERHPVMKDATDLELALEWAHHEGFRSAAVYGALGGRLDQTMATLQTLVHFARCGMHVAAIGEGYAVVALSSRQNKARESSDATRSVGRGDALDAGLASEKQEVEAACRKSCGDASAIANEGSPLVVKLDLPAGIEGVVSVCAVGGDARVTERGLLYEVENVVLPCDSSLGVSNELTGRAACIEVLEGDVIVFLPAMPLDSLR